MIEYNKRNFRSWSIMGINPSIWSIGLADVMQERENIAVLTADLKRYSGLERIFHKYPERCFNLGIAEQNMVGVAAGMAMEGAQSFMTTYAPFMSLRCADQVRHLMGNLNLNMKAIGSAAGFSAGLSGPSLLAVNDIALMRSIPNMTVVTPADCTEAVKMITALAQTKTPAYMRICGTVQIPCVYDEDYFFELGKAVTLRKGQEIALVACGTNLVANALNAANMIFERTGISITVVNMHTIKPLDQECIRQLSQTHRYIGTIEEHSVVGGLGSAVAEFLAKSGSSIRQVFFGIEDRCYQMGSRSYMLEQAGLTAEQIAERVLQKLEKKSD